MYKVHWIVLGIILGLIIGSTIYSNVKQVNKMNTEITLDDDVVDNIVKNALLELYGELKYTQEKRKADFDNLEDCQKEDYKYDKIFLESTKILVWYYTSFEERPEELKNLL